MKNKALYIICKGINWINWLITLFICVTLTVISREESADGLNGYAYIVFVGNILFVVFWFLFSTKGKWFYQIWFFLGYVAAEISMFMPESISRFIKVDANIIQKAVLTLLCIGMFASKIYTLSYDKGRYKADAYEKYNNSSKEKSVKVQKKASQGSSVSSGLTREQQQAIFEINKKYKEGCAAIVKANNDNGAWANSDKTNREIAQLRSQLEREAEQRGVKGKVSIY